jgi:hypothetical protein
MSRRTSGPIADRNHFEPSTGLNLGMPFTTGTIFNHIDT